VVAASISWNVFDPQRESVHRDELSYQFEAFVYHKPPFVSFPSCHCQLLPPPPFLCDSKYTLTPALENKSLLCFNLIP
jgi:hypothetical protein